MTPKEKAENLYNKFNVFDFDIDRGCAIDHKETKIHALICVEEIQSVITRHDSEYVWNYWKQVKTEIEKL